MLEKQEILVFDSVDIQYKKTHAIKDVSFSLRKGEILGIVGESGSGKSTVLKAALGLLGGGKVIKGDIMYDGKNIPDLSEKELQSIRGKHIGMIFQDAGASLCPTRTIGSQIIEAVQVHEKVNAESVKEKSLHIFEKMKFNDPLRVWESYPFELSGGMNQRVAIAMTILMGPEIVLADEPTSALDVVIQQKVIKELLDMRNAYGTSIIVVTHDIGVVSAIADTILVLKQGALMEYGAVKSVLDNPQNPYTKELIDAMPRLKGRE